MYLFLFCHNLQKSSMILPYMSKIQSDTCRGVSLVSTLLLIRFSPRQLFSQLSLQDVGAERLCQLLRAAGQDEIPSKRAMRCSKLVLSIDSRCWKCGTPFKVLFCNSWCNSFQDFSATQPSIKIRLPRNPCQRHPLNWGGASEIGGTRVGSVSCAGLRRDQEELKKTAMEFSLKFLCFFPSFKNSTKTCATFIRVSNKIHVLSFPWSQQDYQFLDILVLEIQDAFSGFRMLCARCIKFMSEALRLRMPEDPKRSKAKAKGKKQKAAGLRVCWILELGRVWKVTDLYCSCWSWRHQFEPVLGSVG